MRSRSYSRSRRSRMTSRWRRPRKPQRKPKPRAAEVSISEEKEASLSWSFSMASRSAMKSAASTGKRPQKTTGWAGLKPGRGSGAPLALGGDGVADAGVADLLDRGGEEADLAGAEAVGGEHAGAEGADALDAGRARRSASCGCGRPCAGCRRRCGRGRRRRGRRRTSESTSMALSGASGSPLGAGRRVTMASRTSGMPRPVLAEISTASAGVDADDVLDLLADAVGRRRRGGRSC